MLVEGARRAAVVGLGALLLGGCLELKAENGSSGGGGGAGGGSGASSSSVAGSGGSVSANPVVMHKGGSGDRYNHLVVDDSFVYWGNGKTLLKLLKSSVEQSTPMDLNGQTADFLAVDKTAVYFTVFGVGGGIGAINHVGGFYKNMSTSEYNPVGLTLYNGALFWAQYGADASIRTMPANGPIDTASTLANGQAQPFFVAVDDSGVYWTYQGTGNNDGSGGVNKTGAAAPYITGLNAPSSLALDADFIYALTRDGALVRTDKKPQTPVNLTTLAPGDGEIFAGRVVVDGNYVYWAGAGTETCTGAKPCPCNPCGNIYRIAKDMGKPEVVASGDWGTVADLAVDGTSVYWTTGHDARLMRIEKPLP